MNVKYNTRSQLQLLNYFKILLNLKWVAPSPPLCAPALNAATQSTKNRIILKGWHVC